MPVRGIRKRTSAWQRLPAGAGYVAGPWFILDHRAMGAGWELRAAGLASLHFERLADVRKHLAAL